MPDFQISTDTQTGRKYMADQLAPTTPVVVGAQDGGTLLLQALADNIDDALLHQNTIIFKGVPDWNGTTGTNNSAAFDAAITAAFASGVATTKCFHFIRTGIITPTP